MGNNLSSLLSHPLTLTLLLSGIPFSESWSLFRKKPLSSSLSSTDQGISLAEATNEMINDALQKGVKGSTKPDETFFHNEMIPPFFSNNENGFFPNMQLPKVLSETIPSYLKAIILYKPPVGITAIYVFFNMIVSRNKNLVSLLLNEEEEQRQIDRSTKMRKKRIGRSLELDESDGKMLIGLGGVESVRTELCLAAIENCIVSINTNNNTKADDGQQVTSENLDLNDLSKPSTLSYYAEAAKDALQMNAIPMSSREDFVQRMIEPLVKLQQLHDIHAQFMSMQSTIRQNEEKLSPERVDDIDIVWMASQVAEVRTIDALLRSLRDRLVLSAVRLSRKEKYRVWRLQWYEKGFGLYFKKWMRRTLKNKTIEDDRRNLQLTRAALKREMERLGQVQQLLLSRPHDLPETRLLTSVKATIDEGGNAKCHTAEIDSTTKSSAGCIDAAGARLALLRVEGDGGKDHNLLNPIKEWTEKAHEWSTKSRGVICDFVTETISDVFDPTSCLSRDRNSTVENDLVILSQWSVQQKTDIEGWSTVLALFDNLATARLLREHKYLPTALDLKYWFKKIDVFGIPSSLATIGTALVIHNMVLPYWNDIVVGAKTVGEAVWGVIKFRFVNPLKDIILDLLNRRPRLLDPFALSNEEQSLDNMLLDLGLGDGTKAGRSDALAAASRMYEKELAQGAIQKIFRGEMVRLLLIQVQQLKTGLLQAMGSIDDLMDSNRLNVQLLATIPAILLVTFGTRLFFRAMYSLRSRDLVGLPSAHAEMKDYLMKMERCLLLSSHTVDNLDESSLSNKSIVSRAIEGSTSFMQPNELGEFVLYMHSYLVILDHCSPPFPAKTCDAIHSGMQDLLMQGQLSTKRQIALLQVRVFP